MPQQTKISRYGCIDFGWLCFHKDAGRKLFLPAIFGSIGVIVVVQICFITGKIFHSFRQVTFIAGTCRDFSLQKNFANYKNNSTFAAQNKKMVRSSKG
ncbi:MAG: hypothetical protein LBI89_01065 [Prevotellaceae bacterium]|nr:hypothetical protein [Prevotellaceae bacterium]